MEESKHRKIGSIFFFWILSFLFAIALVALLLKFMGMPVGQTFLSLGNKIPVINQWIPEATTIHAQAEEDNDPGNWKEELEKKEAELKEKDQKITELTEELSASQKGLEDLEKSQLQLQAQLETKQSESIKEQMKQIAGIYETMSASKAAAVFEVMTLEEAAATIMYLNQEQQSSILGSMKDKKKAAEITLMMKDIALLPDTNELSLDEKIRVLAEEKQNPIAAISETITQMPAAQSAMIIQTMMDTDSELVMDIMRDVSPTILSQILTEIANKDANLAAEITADLN